METVSLRSKRFRVVWEQRKMRNGIFDDLPARKMGQEPKMKDGGGGGKEENAC